MQLTIGFLIAALGGVIFTICTAGGPTAAPLNDAAAQAAQARAEAYELAFGTPVEDQP